MGSGEFTRASSARATHSTLLTLDRLRRLLIGDLGTATALPPAEPTLKTPKLHADTERFAQELDVPSLPAELAVSSDFHPTVPAALDALREMKQVDQIIQRMQNRQTYDARRDAGRAAGAAPAGAQRFALAHASSGTLVQALGVEVVALMIDNIAADDRLVPSVQRLVRSMEPALMQLAVLDPRFFSEKEHPARRLLHEFVQRGLAFESEATTGLAKFIEVTKPPLAKLSRAAIDGAEPFERALSELQKAWAKVIDTVLEPSAMLALQNAEQRHILAEEISEKIAVHPDMAFVPEAVAGFLCGPWSQVIAQACLSGLALESKAQRYQNLVPALLWTANPQSATLNLSRLARTIPPLLATLREGLETIQYPTLKTSEFFDTLMKLHEIAFKNKQVNQASLSPVPFAPAGALLTGPEISSTAPLQAEVWVAPSEAGASNFLAFPENAPDIFLPHTTNTNTNTNANNNHGQNSLAALDQGDISRHAASAEGTTPVRVINAPQVAADVDTTTLVEHPPTTGEPQEPVDGVLSLGELQLGTWVEILTGGRWVRSRLAWVSSHATMYMFTSVGGQSNSMTRRSWLRMMQTGQARSLAEKGLLDRALDGVAQTALRNSINSESS